MAVPADDPRLQRCGFAKLVGDGGKVDVTIRKYEATLGRLSKGKAVDVPLENHKAVSREHAVIRYNFDASERRRRRATTAGASAALRASALAAFAVLLHPIEECAEPSSAAAPPRTPTGCTSAPRPAAS